MKVKYFTDTYLLNVNVVEEHVV